MRRDGTAARQQRRRRAPRVATSRDAGMERDVGSELKGRANRRGARTEGRANRPWLASSAAIRRHPRQQEPGNLAFRHAYLRIGA
jgi:hypothetical protein